VTLLFPFPLTANQLQFSFDCAHAAFENLGDFGVLVVHHFQWRNRTQALVELEQLVFADEIKFPCGEFAESLVEPERLSTKPRVR